MSASIIGLLLTIYNCDVGTIKNDECEDGSKPNKMEIALNVAYPGGIYNFVEIEKNNTTIFIMRDDGTTKQVPSFKIDPIALEFWKTMSEQYKAVCIQELTK